MRKFSKTLLLALGSTLLLAGSAWATPTRQIWIPSVDTQPMGTFNLGVDTYTALFRKEERTKKGPDPGNTPNNTNVGLTAGFSFVPEGTLNLELGIDMRDSNEDPVLFNAKLATPEGEWMPAIAVGGYDFGTDQEKTDYNVVYGLIAKTCPTLGRFSVGYYQGNGAVLKDAQNRDEDDGILLSWDKKVSDKLKTIVDYQGGDNQYGALSFGCSWDITDTANLVAGYQVFNEPGLMGRNGLTFQVGVNF